MRAIFFAKRQASAGSSCKEVGGVCRTKCFKNETMPVTGICKGATICCRKRFNNTQSKNNTIIKTKPTKIITKPTKTKPTKTKPTKTKPTKRQN